MGATRKPARRVRAGSRRHSAVLAAPTAARRDLSAADMRATIPLAAARDAALGRTRTEWDDRTDYLIPSLNTPVRVRAADGTWHDMKGVA